MQVEYLIIGQGISGTWLSYYLQKANKPFLVIDNNQSNSASRVAAGIINPVTGRRIVKTWLIDELLNHLLPAYRELGNELGINVITQKNVIDFYPTPQMKIAFEERLKENDGYIHKSGDENIFRKYFDYDFGYGEVNPCYMVNLQEIIPVWRKKLDSNNQLRKENFDINLFHHTDDAVQYNDIVAKKIIFCDGVGSVHNRFFKNLPFSLNKGEALILDSTEIPSANIFKKGMMLAPLGNNLFWVGSNYLWDFSDDHPTEQFRKQTELILKSWIKLPFKIVDHLAAIRPANIERRPFVGFHPVHKRIGILNGMGTKGTSLAPYFAKQLADYLIHSSPIHPEADVSRFQKILSRD